MASGKGFRLGWPGPGSPGTGAAVYTSSTLDGSTDAAEWIFDAQEAATITKLGFRLTSKTGTSPTFKISLQGRTGGGVPDGTPKGGGTPASATFTVTSITAGDWTWITLDNPYTCTRGERLSIVIAYDSGTIDGSNSIAVSIACDVFGVRCGFPIGIANASGSRTRASGTPLYGYASSSRTFGFPVKAFTETQYSSTSTPDEYALGFTIPSGFGATMQIGGVRITGRCGAAAKSLLVTLYDGTTSLQTVTFDTDDYVSNASGFRSMDYIFDETTLSTLTVGSMYRIGFAPQDTAHNFALCVMETSTSADLDAFPGGTDFFLSTRVDGADWDTDSTTKRPIAEFLIEDFTEPSVGGGGLANSIFGNMIVR